MKRTLSLTAIAVFAVAMTASADLNLTMDLTDLGDGTAQLDIYGELTDISDGLALFGCNLTIDADINLADYLDLDAPLTMASFDRNDGLTNPPGPGNSGYGGTPSGATLLQIGGGQNTIGNTAPPVYPVGSVVEGIGQNGPELLATGILNVEGICDVIDQDFTLTLDAGFANMLKAGEPGPEYPVLPVAVVNGDVLTLTGACGTPPPPITDVYSIANHGATCGDLGIQIWPVPLVFGQPFNSEARYGLTANVLEFGLGGTLADASGITVTATNALQDVFNASVALNPAGDKVIATFSPSLEDAKIYTIELAGLTVPAFQCEYVTLIGNVVNVGGMNTVNSTDRVILNTKLGQAADVAGPQFDIFRIGASACVVDTTDRVILNTKLGTTAE